MVGRLLGQSKCWCNVQVISFLSWPFLSLFFKLTCRRQANKSESGGFFSASCFFLLVYGSCRFASSMMLESSDGISEEQGPTCFRFPPSSELTLLRMQKECVRYEMISVPHGRPVCKVPRPVRPRRQIGSQLTTCLCCSGTLLHVSLFSSLSVMQPCNYPVLDGDPSSSQLNH